MNNNIILKHITQPDVSLVLKSFAKGGRIRKVRIGHPHYEPEDDEKQNFEEIQYNARGQKTKVYLGNDTLKNFTYDEKTFRIKRILTTRNSGQDILQDLNYTYDPVGNIVEIKDNAQQTFYFNNSVVSPTAKYYYDPTYRLTKAKGREAADNGQPSDGDIPAFIGFPYNNSSAEVEIYTQKYEYDEGGNITKVIHQSNSGNWTRGYHYNTSTSNHLLKTSAPGDDPDDHNTYSHHYTHDARGNMTSMPHLSDIKRNLKDEISEVDLGGGGTVWYQYDESGQRVRKVWNTGNKIRHRIYIGDYEVWREYDGGTLDNERETIHINGEEKRFALVETQTVENGNSVTSVNIRYQYGNQVESACLELNEEGDIITYEEYHPFGTSAIRMGSSQSEVETKRYRYNGKERDEETGLYYYGARYYTAWLGRFLRVDPEWIGSANMTSYHYVSNNPVNRVDPFGRQDEEKSNEGSIFRVGAKDVEGGDPNLFLSLQIREDKLPEHFKNLNVQNIEDLADEFDINIPEMPDGDIGQKDIVHGDKRIRANSRYKMLFDLAEKGLGVALNSIEPEAYDKVRQDAMAFREDFILMMSALDTEGLVPDMFEGDMEFAADLFNYIHAGDTPNDRGLGESYQDLIEVTGDFVKQNEHAFRHPSFELSEDIDVMERNFESEFDNATYFDELNSPVIISYGASFQNAINPLLETIEKKKSTSEPKRRNEKVR